MSIAFALENDFQLKGNKKITEEAYRWFKINPLVFFIGKKTFYYHKLI